MKNKKFRAFSLTEMSVAVLVIGILIAGITQGSKMIKKSQINNAKSLTKNSVVNNINGLSLWFETSLDSSFKASESIDNSSVGTWYDNSPSSLKKLNLTQSNDSYKPIYIKNGIGNLPSLQFDGVDDFLNGNNLNLGANLTIFVVFNIDQGALSATRDILAVFYDSDANLTNGNGMHGILIEATSSSTLRLLYRSPLGGGGGDSIFSTTTISENKNYIASVTRNLPNASLRAWFNNAAIISQANNPPVTNASFNYQNLDINIGALADNNPPARAFKGKISEIIIFDRSLTQSEIDNIELYLSKKYNIDML